MERVRARRREGESTCPYCHGELEAQEQVVCCGGCAAVYHSDCLRDELKSCATLGCEVRPELGKAFAWGERGPGITVRPGAGLACCSAGASKASDPIHVCQGCGSLLHASCLERRGACCPEHTAVPLVETPREPGKLLSYRLLAALVVLACVFAALLKGELQAGVDRTEVFVFVAGTLAVLGSGVYVLSRQLRR